MADILSQEEIDALLEVVDENVDIQNVQKRYYPATQRNSL